MTTASTTRTHARYSPSKLGRIIACPGSVKLSETVPEPPETSYAAEGTLLHDIMIELIHATDVDKVSQAEAVERIDFQNTEHRVLCSECLEKLYTEIVDTLTNPVIHQDMRVHMPGLEDDVHGTLDVGVDSDTAVHILDFKFGGGVEVDAEDNAQLMTYLDGFLSRLGIDLDTTNKELWVWIFQPRLDKFQGVQVFKEDLLYFRKRVEKTVILAQGHYPPFRPGVYQCRFCPAGGICKARMVQVQEDAANVFSAFADLQSGASKDTMSNEKLAKILQMEEQIESAFKAIREHLFGELLAARDVPGYKLVNGRASRKWKDGIDVEDIHNLFPDLDTDDLLKVELRSPAQVEKLVPSKERSKLADLIIKIDGSPSLAAATSQKQALDASGLTPQAQAEKTFADFADSEESQ